MVFTLFGEYLLGRGEAVWVGSLISLLAPFELSEGAVRTTLSRMVRKGWLLSVRVGRHSFYRPTDRGRRLLEEGQARIFHTSWDHAWDGSWFLLAYSIPQDDRHLRDRLRDRLSWLGCGSLGNGLWISPHDVSERVLRVAEQLGIEAHVECFRAKRIGGGAPGALVAKCWDLARLNRKYGDFIDAWAPRLDGPRAPGERDERSAYVDRFALIHEYRGFPLEDPYLPRELLPSDWCGERASRLFHQLHDALLGPSDAYVEAVLAQAPVQAVGEGAS